MKVYVDLFAGALLFIAVAAMSLGHLQYWSGAAMLSSLWICFSNYLTVAGRDWRLSRIGLEHRGSSIYISGTDVELEYSDVHAIQKVRASHSHAGRK